MLRLRHINVTLKEWLTQQRYIQSHIRMNILGVSAFYHDSAAALVKDGEIIAAAQEERFTRKKHDPSYPSNAIRYCLDEGKIQPNEIHIIAYYDKPFLTFERLLQTYFSYAPRGIVSFNRAIPLWVKSKLWIKDLITPEGFNGKNLFYRHHTSHAASAFYPSPFEKAAILTVDGVGEWATASISLGDNNTITPLTELRFPHSVGLLYSAFTHYLGFKVNSGEYKVMGLAPYGEPLYRNLILSHICDIKDDGSIRLDMRYFNYCVGSTMTSRRFHALFKNPVRKPDDELTQFHMDVAASIQSVTEEIILRMSSHAQKITGAKKLCLAGGVALNCTANGRLLRESSFDDIWIQPAAGDAGGAIGAALCAWHENLGNTRTPRAQSSMKGSFLGPRSDINSIETYLLENNIPYKKLGDNELPHVIADHINAQKVVGLFQGRMEFGPRALGSRSILGDARSEEMQSTMNLKIKFRESFRPFAPIVLEEDAASIFEIDRPSPFMLFTVPLKKELRILPNETDKAKKGIELLKVKRSNYPAITHVDYSSRIQTINRNENPFIHAVLSSLKMRFGCPIAINTSFNVRGEPIVCTHIDAYRCFMRSEIDSLFIENFLIIKEDNPPVPQNLSSEKFILD